MASVICILAVCAYYFLSRSLARVMHRREPGVSLKLLYRFTDVCTILLGAWAGYLMFADPIK